MRLSKSSAYKFIAINIYIKKESNLRLSSIMRNQGENGVNPTQSKHEEIKKILAKISDIEKRKITEKKNQQNQIWFFEKTNNIENSYTENLH